MIFPGHFEVLASHGGAARAEIPWLEARIAKERREENRVVMEATLRAIQGDPPADAPRSLVALAGERVDAAIEGFSAAQRTAAVRDLVGTAPEKGLQHVAGLRRLVAWEGKAAVPEAGHYISLAICLSSSSFKRNCHVGLTIVRQSLNVRIRHLLLVLELDLKQLPLRHLACCLDSAVDQQWKTDKNGYHDRCVLHARFSE